MLCHLYNHYISLLLEYQLLISHNKFPTNPQYVLVAVASQAILLASLPLQLSLSISECLMCQNGIGTVLFRPDSAVYNTGLVMTLFPTTIEIHIPEKNVTISSQN